VIRTQPTLKKAKNTIRCRVNEDGEKVVEPKALKDIAEGFYKKLVCPKGNRNAIKPDY
jgi:hypothetical protein